MENTRISKKLLTFPRNQLKSNEFRYDCIYFARIFKKLFTFSTPKKRMPYALNEANFKKLFTFFVVLKSWKTQITNAVQSKNFYFLLASIQIPRASLWPTGGSRAPRAGPGRSPPGPAPRKTRACSRGRRRPVGGRGSRREERERAMIHGTPGCKTVASSPELQPRVALRP